MSTTRPDPSAATPEQGFAAGGVQHTAHGFIIVAATFLLVVLSGLAAFLVNITSATQLGSAIDFQGSRAYWAARSAAEHGLMQLLQPEDTSGASSFALCMGVPQAVTLSGLTDLTVQITNCQRNPASGAYAEDGLNLVTYTVTAMASLGTVGAANRVEREVSVTAAKCKDPAALGDARYRCF